MRTTTTNELLHAVRMNTHITVFFMHVYNNSKEKDNEKRRSELARDNYETVCTVRWRLQISL